MTDVTIAAKYKRSDNHTAFSGVIVLTEDSLNFISDDTPLALEWGFNQIKGLKITEQGLIQGAGRCIFEFEENSDFNRFKDHIDKVSRKYPALSSLLNAEEICTTEVQCGSEILHEGSKVLIQNESNATVNWGNLPVPVVYEILRRLWNSGMSLSAFRNFSDPWSSLASLYDFKLRKGIYLILPYDEMDKSRLLYSVETGLIHHETWPQVKGSIILFSAEGWLLLLYPNNRISLHNPMTSQKMNLPPVNMGCLSGVTGFLNGNPMKGKWIAILIASFTDHFCISAFRSGDINWTKKEFKGSLHSGTCIGVLDGKVLLSSRFHNKIEVYDLFGNGSKKSIEFPGKARVNKILQVNEIPYLLCSPLLIFAVEWDHVTEDVSAERKRKFSLFVAGSAYCLCDPASFTRSDAEQVLDLSADDVSYIDLLIYLPEDYFFLYNSEPKELRKYRGQILNNSKREPIWFSPTVDAHC